MKLLITILMLVSPFFAFGNSDHREQARALNAQVDILMNELKATRDTSTYYLTLQQAIRTALRCDSLDALPDSRGKVKPIFRNNNFKRLEPIRAKLIDAGAYYHGYRRNTEAVECFALYVESSQAPLFTHKGHNDLYRGQAAYYASLLYFGLKQYPVSDHYADIALKDEDYARDAAEIKVSCMKEMMTTHTDSARYFLALLELHDRAPKNRTYSHMILEYLSSPGHQQEMVPFARDEVRKDSTNEMAWALLGETQMHDGHWDEAIDAYKRAVALSPDFVEGLYNLGVSYSAKAQILIKQDNEKASTSDEKDDSSEKNSAKPNSSEQNSTKPTSNATMTIQNESRAGDPTYLLQRAKECLNKTRQLDPDRDQVDWAKPLLQVCILLKDNKEAEEILPLVNPQKQKKTQQ